MAHTELVMYIRTELEKGVSRDAISQALRSSTWSPADVTAAFAELDNVTAIRRQPRVSKKVKIFTLIVGSLALLLILANTSFSGSINFASYKTDATPEIAGFESGLQQLHPEGKIGVQYTTFDQPEVLREHTYKTILNAQVETKSGLTATMLSDTGKQLCSDAFLLGVPVDIVDVKLIERHFVLFYKHIGAAGTCDEWQTDVIYNAINDLLSGQP